MYKIELNYDTTLEGLLESFKNLKECGIDGYVEIDGIKFYGSDPNLEKKLTKQFQLRKKEIKTEPIISEKIEQKKDDELSQALNLYGSLFSLSRNTMFKYYLGISLKYTKPELREELKRSYINLYSDDKYIRFRDIHLFASILLILEYKDVLVIQEKLNLFFLNVSKEDMEKLDDTFRYVKRYAINASLFEQCLSTDILEKDKENTYKKMHALSKKRQSK